MKCLGFLLLVPLAQALRDSYEIDSLVNASTRNIKKSRTEEMAGIHVCCLEIDDKKGQWNLVVYHESSESKINDCKMTLMSEVECDNKADCDRECKTRMDNHPQFHNFISKIKAKTFMAKLMPLEQAKESSKDKHQNKVAALEEAYLAKLKQFAEEKQEMEQKLAGIEEEETLKEAELKALQTYNDQLQGQVPALREKIEAHEKKVAEYKATGKADLEEKKTAAQGELDKVMDLLEGKVSQVEAERAEYHERVKSLEAQPVPVGCKGKRDCCCLVLGTPIRVHKQFEDWGLCEKAQPYADTSNWGWPCDEFTECGKCRDLICKGEMC